MPDCSENYESEISEGRNSRNVKCKFCGSVILTPSTATFTSFEVSLIFFCLCWIKNLVLVSVTSHETK